MFWNGIKFTFIQKFRGNVILITKESKLIKSKIWIWMSFFYLNRSITFSIITSIGTGIFNLEFVTSEQWAFIDNIRLTSGSNQCSTAILRPSSMVVPTIAMEVKEARILWKLQADSLFTFANLVLTFLLFGRTFITFFSAGPQRKGLSFEITFATEVNQFPTAVRT